MAGLEATEERRERLADFGEHVLTAIREQEQRIRNRRGTYAPEGDDQVRMIEADRQACRSEGYGLVFAIARSHGLLNEKGGAA